MKAVQAEMHHRIIDRNESWEPFLRKCSCGAMIYSKCALRNHFNKIRSLRRNRKK